LKSQGKSKTGSKRITQPQEEEVISIFGRPVNEYSWIVVENGMDVKPADGSIFSHEGKKYLREIISPVDGTRILVDVYAVLEAFGVICQARGHAIKKLLSAGERGKGDALADLVGAQAAVSRAIDLQKMRDQKRGKT
jgi:hypothetical protein